MKIKLAVLAVMAFMASPFRSRKVQFANTGPDAAPPPPKLDLDNRIATLTAERDSARAELAQLKAQPKAIEHVNDGSIEGVLETLTKREMAKNRIPRAQAQEIIDKKHPHLVEMLNQDTKED